MTEKFPVEEAADINESLVVSFTLVLFVQNIRARPSRWIGDPARQICPHAA